MEQKVARIAGQAQGVVTRRELLDAGLSAAQIEHRLRIGALLVEYPGVYSRSPRAECGGALHGGGEGVRRRGGSERFGGRVPLGLLRSAAVPVPEVTAPARRRVKGVKTRRARAIDPRDATTWKGIPITTVPRTLVDLAAVLSFDDLALACHEAGVRHRTTPAQVEAVLARRPTSPGAGSLRRILRGEARVALSPLEKRSWG